MCLRLKFHLIHYHFVHLENNNCLTFRDYIKRLVSFSFGRDTYSFTFAMPHL